MNRLFLVSIIAGIIVSCNNASKYNHFLVDISEFTINDSILKDGDSVQILGSSGNLSENDKDKMDFYNLVVVKSLKTGDTVNVLVTNYFMADLNNPITQFISNTSQTGMAVDNILNQALKGKAEDIKIEDIKLRKFDKVFYDKEYIQVDVRNFPAITGNLGFCTYEED